MRILRFHVYMITNARNGTIYTGHTDNLDQRMCQHITGTFDGFSKKYNLKHLVWFEEHTARHDAFIRERRIKEWDREWKINLINETNPLWIDLHTVPYWPLPDSEKFPDMYMQCLGHRIAPDLRRDERR